MKKSLIAVGLFVIHLSAFAQTPANLANPDSFDMNQSEMAILNSFQTSMNSPFQNVSRTYRLPDLRLAKFANTNMEYHFLSGNSLWRDKEIEHMASPCANDKIGSKPISPRCQEFLRANEKAQLKWGLQNNPLNAEQHYVG